jgi:serine/threonine-protein kinase
MVLEFVDGELLRDLLQREKRFPVPKALDLAIQIADALIYLHEHSVVHRDLKPENVMVTRDGRVKLVDFGIALDTTLRKMTWAGLSQTVGTPDYMAPEQVRGKRGDARTDIYSLGVMLYEMLTGEVPFPGDNVYAAMRAKTNDDPTPPRRLRPEISPALEETILHALERDPRDRPQSALEFREALAHPESVVITNRAARQRPKPRMPRWVRALIAIGVPLLGYAVLFWLLSHAG